MIANGSYLRRSNIVILENKIKCFSIFFQKIVFQTNKNLKYLSFHLNIKNMVFHFILKVKPSPSVDFHKIFFCANYY